MKAFCLLHGMYLLVCVCGCVSVCTWNLWLDYISLCGQQDWKWIFLLWCMVAVREMGRFHCFRQEQQQISLKRPLQLGQENIVTEKWEHFSLSLIFPCGICIARPLPWSFSSLFLSFLHQEEPHLGGGYGRQYACLRECVPCLLSAMPMQPVLLRASSFQHPLCHVGEFHFRPKCHWLAFLIIS